MMFWGAIYLMEFFDTKVLIISMVLLYFTAAFSSLVLIKNHKISNIISNSICILASLLGIIASLKLLFSGVKMLDILNITSPIPNISFSFKMDKISSFFILVLSILVLCVSIYSLGYISHYYGKRNVGLFNLLYSSFIVSMIFVMSSGNMVFFFIAWEAMSMLSYFLVVFESEDEDNQRAGTLYIVMMHIGTAFLLIAFMIIFSYTNSFDMHASSAAIPPMAKNILFFLFIIGFGTKAGIIPFHIWLPYAHPAAPSNVSALMSGIMIKTAVYGILRFVLMFLGVQVEWWGIVILVIGIFSSVLGVAYAFAQKNIKKLLAYHSIENIGIIFIGLGIGFIAQANGNHAISSLAITASLFHTFNHALFKGGLFLGAGSIHYATGTKNLEDLGGLIKKMPITALLFLGGALSISAIVPFNGFVSEWLTYQSIFATISLGQSALNVISIITVAALALSGALAAACFVKIYGITFLGLPRTQKAIKAKEVPLPMNIGVGLLILLCLIAGVFPLVFLKIIGRTVFDMIGESIFGQLQGGLFFTYYPLTVAQNSISPVMILILIVLVIIGTLLTARIIGGRYIERKYGTWDCGFEALNSRMQYTATGFSKPLKIVFRLLFRTSRDLKIESGSSVYHPKTIKYKVATESVFEKYLYMPAFKFTKKFSKKIKFSVQTGSIHMYLIYIFVTVLLLMLYNRFA